MFIMIMPKGGGESRSIEQDATLEECLPLIKQEMEKGNHVLVSAEIPEELIPVAMVDENDPSA